MDTSQRTRRGRRPELVAALFAVCAFGSVPALAQVQLGPDLTVPLPVGGGNEGSSPASTTTTTTTPPPSTPPTAVPTTAPTTASTAPAPAAPAETARRSGATTARRASTPSSPAPGPGQTFDIAPAVTDEQPAIARLRQVTLPAARQFGFPLALAVLVLAFLAVQGRLDARDPKLAAAPLSVDDDLLPFT